MCRGPAASPRVAAWTDAVAASPQSPAAATRCHMMLALHISYRSRSNRLTRYRTAWCTGYWSLAWTVRMPCGAAISCSSELGIMNGICATRGLHQNLTFGMGFARAMTVYTDAESDNHSSALSFGNVRPCLSIYSPDHLVNEDIHQAGLQVGRERWH